MPNPNLPPYFQSGPGRRDRILNELPARELPPKPVGDNPPTHWAPVWRPRLPVKVRLDWEDDGEEWMPTMADAYDPRDGAVYVYIHDSRSWTTAIWVHASDIQVLGPPADE